jgi:hypothetical protein
MRAEAERIARMDGFQQAKYGIGRGAGMLAGAGMEAAGYQNPAVAQAKMREQQLADIDMSTSKGVLTKALQTQDPRMKAQLTFYGQQLQAKEQETALKRAQELAALHKAQSEASPLAKIPFEKATPESRKQYMTTKNIGDLEFPDPEDKRSVIARELIDAGEEPGTKRFYDLMDARIKAHDAGKAKGGGTTVVMPGEKAAIDIPKFEHSVQSTIKPHLETVTAVDMATAALQNSIKTGNYSSFNSAKQQLARAFSDKTISREEVIAAGADPSMIGGIVDSTSTLFTGTPSIDTQQKMLKTLEIARKVAANKGQTALNRMKKVGEMSGIKKDQLDTLLTFPEFDGKSNGSASSDDALIQKHLKKKPK